MKLSKTLERWSPMVLLAAILLVWQVAVWLFRVPDFIFPGPVQIALEFVEFKGPLLEAAWKTFWVTMVGFGLSGEITETLQIESVVCRGGVNLLWHDEWTSLLAYQGDTVSLRENPIICAPNCVEFSLRNVGKYPVQFSLWALGEPVESAL